MPTSAASRFVSDGLGRAVGASPMRAPPSWPPRRPWPPRVEAARKGLGRNPMRSALAYFSLAAALGHRGIAMGPAGVDDLVEAYAIFSKIAESGNAHHFARYRALALMNATTCMQSLPSRQARRIAGDLLTRAIEAIGDSIVDSVKQVFVQAESDLATQMEPQPLRWWKRRPFLLPDNEKAKQRVRSLKDSIEGSWDGVRRGLLDRGLLSPALCAVRSPVVRALPMGRSIEVVSA